MAWALCAVARHPRNRRGQQDPDAPSRHPRSRYRGGRQEPRPLQADRVRPARARVQFVPLRLYGAAPAPRAAAQAVPPRRSRRRGRNRTRTTSPVARLGPQPVAGLAVRQISPLPLLESPRSPRHYQGRLGLRHVYPLRSSVRRLRLVPRVGGPLNRRRSPLLGRGLVRRVTEVDPRRRWAGPRIRRHLRNRPRTHQRLGTARGRGRRATRKNHGQQAAAKGRRTYGQLYRRLLPLRHPAAQHASDLRRAGRVTPRCRSIPLGWLSVVVGRRRSPLRRILFADLSHRRFLLVGQPDAALPPSGGKGAHPASRSRAHRAQLLALLGAPRRRPVARGARSPL